VAAYPIDAIRDPAVPGILVVSSSRVRASELLELARSLDRYR